MTYIDSVVEAIDALVPGCETELLRLYAVLVLVKGADVTRADVHHAWAAWRVTTKPDHRSLVPFEDLTPEVQALDDPYVDAIRTVAANGLSDRTSVDRVGPNGPCTHPLSHAVIDPCPDCGVTWEEPGNTACHEKAYSAKREGE